MATQIFLLSTFAPTHRGDNSAKLDGTTAGWTPHALSLSRGSGVTAMLTTAAVAGTTLGVEIWDGSVPREWISEPLAADVTISGVITGNIWAAETDMNGNVAINFNVDVIDSATGTITLIVKSARTTEVALTTRAVNNFTATPGAGVACKAGDRLRIRIFGDDAGTMGAAGTFNIGVNGSSAAADGDTYITFTEAITFASVPAGSVIYLTDTASDINPGAAVEKEAWTSRGAGSVNGITNTAAGWTAPIQVTNTAGGTAIEWYTKALSAFTLDGTCRFNIRALESNVAANASVAAEVAITATDGSGPTVVGIARIMDTVSGFGEVTASDVAYTADVGVDATAVTAGQRLRFRLYVDDLSKLPLVTGHTVTVTYSGTSGGAAGDTFVTLPQAVTEAAAAGSLIYQPYSVLTSR